MRQDPNAPAWELLLANRANEAGTIFSANTASRDRAVAGEAHRGLAEVDGFLGDENGGCRETFKAFRADNDTLMLASAIGDIQRFGRTAEGHHIDEGYPVLEDLAGQPGPFCGEFQDVLATRYLADGYLSKAAGFVRRMGCILDWKYIGPFENISSSGYAAEYPPEREIDFSKTYPGKDGADVSWHDLKTAPTSAWIFMGDHSSEQNAVDYFSCTVTSKTEQRARLAFGASGTFAIFLNGTRVLADSVFRNTGIDVYMQEVQLHKGGNSLLLKLGHEWAQRGSSAAPFSNFSLRFLDERYRPLSSLTVNANAVVNHPSGETKPVELRPQPLYDSVAAALRGRLLRNPGDIDAALRLAGFYNGADMTDESQSFLRAWLKKYPKSALLHGLLSISLLQSKKHTDMQTEAHTAWTLSPDYCYGWAAEMRTVAQGGDPQQTLKFIEQSPANCAATFFALANKMIACSRTENRNAAIACIQQMRQRYPLNEEAQGIVAAFDLEQGDAAAAEQLWNSYLDHDHASVAARQALTNIVLKQGRQRKAIDILHEGLRYRPIDATAWYTMANLHYLNKEYAPALEFIDSALAVMPAGPELLNLRGTILQAMGDRARARGSFTDAVHLTRNNFNAWENLRALDNKPEIDSMAALPAPDALVGTSALWSGRSNENGAILSYIRDIFCYPDRSSKERTFLLVYLPTANAVDRWKEYTIGLNGYYQVATISRALTLKAGGTQVPADREYTKIVFKSLQPGDCILLEWTLKNYYNGELAHQVWGEEPFRLNVPVFDQRLRFVTPASDTIPYTVWGDSVSRAVATAGDYRITTFSRTPYLAHDRELFEATDWASNPKVTFSTFTQWSQIADWYLHLTEHLQTTTLELNALADSLFAGAASAAEKAGRIQRYITDNIRYSYVSFRQSAWIPQQASEVVASRIGDCKDMASLGRLLLRKAGIPADLVLVNTGEHQFIDHACIGPEFNHCIAACTIDGVRRFIDFTYTNGSLFTLPPMDQSALALDIRRGSAAPEMLPLDSAGRRSRVRTVKAVLDPAGTLTAAVTVKRAGIEAANNRAEYRYLPVEKRAIGLQKSVVEDYPDVSIDTFFITNLDTLSDTVELKYAYTARNTVTLSGTTAIFSFHLPDALKARTYPSEEKRYTPVDFTESFLSGSTQSQHAELSLPEGWKPINLPPPVTLHSPYGTYSIEFSRDGRTIAVDRHAVFSLSRQIPVAEYGAVKEFLNAVAKADAVQLVFFTK
jgi:tetratricopeptide (TPR) repeat protein